MTQSPKHIARIDANPALTLPAFGLQMRNHVLHHGTHAVWGMAEQMATITDLDLRYLMQGGRGGRSDTPVEVLIVTKPVG